MPVVIFLFVFWNVILCVTKWSKAESDCVFWTLCIVYLKCKSCSVESPLSDDPKCTDLVVPYLEVVAYKI